MTLATSFRSANKNPTMALRPSSRTARLIGSPPSAADSKGCSKEEFSRPASKTYWGKKIGPARCAFLSCGIFHGHGEKRRLSRCSSSLKVIVTHILGGQMISKGDGSDLTNHICRNLKWTLLAFHFELRLPGLFIGRTSMKEGCS